MVHMTISYNKLWKLLIDKGMKKKDLQIAAGIYIYIVDTQRVKC